jgi:hypothetical protein
VEKRGEEEEKKKERRGRREGEKEERRRREEGEKEKEKKESECGCTADSVRKDLCSFTNPSIISGKNNEKEEERKKG